LRVPDWTFLTNHTHVLLAITRDPGARLRDDLVAVAAPLARRLEVAARLELRPRARRRHPDVPLRHLLERDHTVGEVLAVLRDRRRAA